MLQTAPVKDVADVVSNLVVAFVTQLASVIKIVALIMSFSALKVRFS